MLAVNQLKDVVHRDNLKRLDIALLCVAAAGGLSIPTSEVRRLAIQVGVKDAKKINFSAVLSSADGRVFRTPKGWELTATGRKRIDTLCDGIINSPIAIQTNHLRNLLSGIKNENTHNFLTEAITCAESSLYRAAVVLSWAGAISLLHSSVIANHLQEFNAEVSKRNKHWKNAKTEDDLSLLKESVFIEIACIVGLFGKDVKQQLELALRLRNSCGHPNSLRIGPNKVAAHLEILALNIYSRYG